VAGTAGAATAAMAPPPEVLVDAEGSTAAAGHLDPCSCAVDRGGGRGQMDPTVKRERGVNGAIVNFVPRVVRRRNI
jgi:hypothetical protein